MPKKFKAEVLKRLKEGLKKPKKPQKREYTKAEVLMGLRPEITKLRERGFSFAEIAELIADHSEGEINTSGKNLSVLFRKKSAKELNGNTSDTPPSYSVTTVAESSVENEITLPEIEEE